MIDDAGCPNQYPGVIIKKGSLVGKAHSEAPQMQGLIHVLVKTDADFLTAVVSERDLVPMITHGVYVEIDQHCGCFHQVFVGFNTEGE